MENENDPIGRLYKEVMTQELREIDLAEEKRLFIAQHFEEAPALSLHPEFFVPAAVFALFAAFAVNLWPGRSAVLPLPAEPAAVMREAAVHAPAAEAPAAPEMPVPPEHQVSVERVSSDMGIPVIFQKMVNNSPVTVVWVFPRADIVQGG